MITIEIETYRDDDDDDLANDDLENDGHASPDPGHDDDNGRHDADHRSAMV